MKPETAPSSSWIDPEEEAPPAGRKLLLLTAQGCAVIGKWDVGFIAWAYLPEIPPKIKAKLRTK